jgi:hypothetical protein
MLGVACSSSAAGPGVSGTDAASDGENLRDVMASQDAGSGADSSFGDGGGSFADVQAIFDDRCVMCHAADNPGLPGYPELPLTHDVAYGLLVNRPALEMCGGTYVVPGQPDQSYLFRKVNDDMPCNGLRMPARMEVGPMVPLTAAQIATIRTWIERGALP